MISFVTTKTPWAPLPLAWTTLSGILSLSNFANLSIRWGSWIRTGPTYPAVMEFWLSSTGTPWEVVSCDIEKIKDIYVQYNWDFINHETIFLFYGMVANHSLLSFWGSIHMLFLCHCPKFIILNSFLEIICFLNFRFEFFNRKLFNLFLILFVFRP